jgi:hypothetical protein
MKSILVLGFVIIGLAASITLNYAAKNNIEFWFLLIIYLLVLVLNIFRFIYWGFLLKKFDLSGLYPLTSLFFPLIYLYSIFNGEADYQISKIAGVCIIIFGILIFEKKTTA